MIVMIYDDANDVDVDVLMHVSNDHNYDGDDIIVNDNDSCDRSHNFTQKLKNETVQKWLATVNAFINQK